MECELGEAECVAVVPFDPAEPPPFTICSPACSDASECPAGGVCEMGTCVANCSTDSDCPDPAMACTASMCMYPS